jgi:hypothetical protein
MKRPTAILAVTSVVAASLIFAATPASPAEHQCKDDVEFVVHVPPPSGVPGQSMVPAVEESPATRAEERQAGDGEGDVTGFGADLVIAL